MDERRPFDQRSKNIFIHEKKHHLGYRHLDSHHRGLVGVLLENPGNSTGDR
jgi:hypothetical protein